MAVMHSTIFFDFVGAYGDLSLTTQLRQYLLDLLGDRARVFFYHLALNSLKMKPPLGFFRNFVVESKGEHRNTFDIKKAMTPIVDFARIYALENRMEATNTQERLHQLFVEEVINEEEYHELVQSYRYLMQVRLVRQVSAITEDQNPPDNYVNPQKLTHIEQKMLKEIFSSIEKYQQKLSVHFTGIA
jgi:CBS domain-containing protein